MAGALGAFPAPDRGGNAYTRGNFVLGEDVVGGGLPSFAQPPIDTGNRRVYYAPNFLGEGGGFRCFGSMLSGLFLPAF
jgi:hypothetical protein